jgi:hypothetical protein
MKTLSLSLLLLCLVGCGGHHSGGASYTYSHVNPDGSRTDVTVDSVREVDAGIQIEFSPDGTVNVATGALTSGVNNLGQVLSIADKMVTTAAKVALAVP